MRMCMLLLQLLLYCLLFTAMVKLAVIGGAINGLYFYPKAVQDRAIELGLTTRETMNRKRKLFMTSFYIVMLAALVLIIGAGTVSPPSERHICRRCCFLKL